MDSFRYRPNTVGAMRFDGSPASAQAIIALVHEQVPDLVVRRRIEYLGWDDVIGHVELEIRDHDRQCASGDWIVLQRLDSLCRLQVMSDEAFHRCFESVPA